MNDRIKYDSKYRRNFLNNSLGVIANWTKEFTGKQTTLGFSDELSLAIIAFNTAIDKFNDQGNFYDFAKEQVRQKLMASRKVNMNKQKSLGKNYI